ncbi:hypothetical protein ACP70R_046462 [Stipagrostis hirtigluma subsp. patula]
MAAPPATGATQPPAGSSSAATAYPRWVQFEQRVAEDSALGSDSTADARTVAAARTSTGHSIAVSLRLAAPPAESRVCVHLPHSVDRKYATILAAHGDSVLIQIAFKPRGGFDQEIDYFVYIAGGGAGAGLPRPPSLCLLPPCYRTEEEAKRYGSRPPGPVKRYLTLEEAAATGLLRRGEDELVVAELLKVGASGGEVLLLRAGEWAVKRLPVTATRGKLPSSWSTHTTLPVGDELLCWADPYHGLIFADVLGDSPTLRHVPFPADAARPASGPTSSRDVCATADGAVRFVNVSPRCCCGDAGATHCRSSRHAYTITTWTLRMDDMAWVMDGMVDATELWRLDAYAGVPREQPARPVVSLDDPHAISFLVCERTDKDYGDDTLWVIVLDMRKKTLRSVSLHPGTEWYIVRDRVFPSTISSCFDSSPSTGASAARKSRHTETIEPPELLVDGELYQNRAGHSVLQSSCKSPTEPNTQASSTSTILAALEEIPGLCRDDMLKAYSILSLDNGRRLIALLGLPVSLRKDWLLMEIKASEAVCSMCAACTAHLRYA